MSGYGDYLERNYDVGREEEQVKEDIIRAQEIEAEIEEKKSQMKNRAIEQVAKEKGILEVDTDNEDSLYNEYVNMEGDFNKQKIPHTTLHAYENPISDNGLIFATVGDTIKDINIIPFKCKCKIEADRESEINAIKADKSCARHGVCRHLMQLNPEWENVSFDGGSYLSKTDISGSVQVPDNYLQQVRYGIVKNSSIAVEKEGINMCSILFCKHGGIITPVNSGQKRVNSAIVFAAPCIYKNNPLIDAQRRMNAEYIYSYLSACG